MMPKLLKSVCIGFLVAVLLVALLVVARFAIWRSSLYVVMSRGYECSICAAMKVSEETSIAGVTIRRRVAVHPSGLTKLRERLVGVCAHDWVLDWSTYERGSGAKTHGDCFVSFDHPACSSPDRIVAGIERLRDDSAKAQALRAVGDRDNFLKWVAYDFVLEIAFLEDEEFGEIDWDDWWQRHAWAFDVCHGKEVARQLVLDNLTDWRGYGAGKTLGLLDLSEEDEAPAPPGPQEFRGLPGR